MAYDFPLPDIERARTIIDALAAMVVGEPCPACSGEGYITRPAKRTATRQLVDCHMCAGFGVVGGATQAQGEAIATLFEGDRRCSSCSTSAQATGRSRALAPGAGTAPGSRRRWPVPKEGTSRSDPAAAAVAASGMSAAASE